MDTKAFDALQIYERETKEVINNCFSNLIKEANDFMGKMMNSILLGAENVEAVTNKGIQRMKETLDSKLMYPSNIKHFSKQPLMDYFPNQHELSNLPSNEMSNPIPMQAADPKKESLANSLFIPNNNSRDIKVEDNSFSIALNAES